MSVLLSKFTLHLKRRRSPTAELSHLQSVERLQDMIDQERARADRGGVGFAILKFVPRDPGHAQGTLTCLAKILKWRLRFTDHAGWFRTQQIGVVLTDTTAKGARSVASDIIRCFAEMTPPRCQIFCYSAEPTSQKNNTRNGQDASAAAINQCQVQHSSIRSRTLTILGSQFSELTVMEDGQ
jgi:hypothetical protein